MLWGVLSAPEVRTGQVSANETTGGGTFQKTENRCCVLWPERQGRLQECGRKALILEPTAGEQWGVLNQESIEEGSC